MVKKTEIEWSGVALFLLASVCGISSFLFGGPFIHDNNEASELVTTVFSIFAGFVVAIASVLGTPASDVEKQGWQTLELRRGNVFRRLTRQKWLFIVYMITITTLFASTLTKNAAATDPQMVCAYAVLERAFLGLAVFSFVLSFGLPGALIKIQLSRYEEIIDDKKDEAEGTQI